MVIEASSSTSLTLPDNVTVIQGTLPPSLAGSGDFADKEMQLATLSTGMAWTSSCWPSPTRPSTPSTATKSSTLSTRRGGTSSCCRRAGTLLSRLSQKILVCGYCIVILRGTRLLVSLLSKEEKTQSRVHLLTRRQRSWFANPGTTRRDCQKPRRTWCARGDGACVSELEEVQC